MTAIPGPAFLRAETGDGMITQINSWYVQTYDNPVIREIRFRPDSTAVCRVEVYLQDGSRCCFQTPFSAVSAARTGIPISEDGALLYIWDSERGNGLRALDSRTGRQVWRMPAEKVRAVFAFADCGVALRGGEALLKFNLRTGETLASLKSSAADAFRVDGDRILTASEDRLELVRVSAFTREAEYSAEQFNPNRCLCVRIREVRPESGRIVISGVEQYPNETYSRRDNAWVEFTRYLPL